MGPPLLPTTLPLLHTQDTLLLPLLTPLPPLLMPDTPLLPPSPMPAMPSLPLPSLELTTLPPSLELTPPAFPTTVNSTLFNPFSRPETPFPPESVPQRMQQHSTA